MTRLAALAVAVLVVACAPQRGDPLRPDGAEAPPPATGTAPEAPVDQRLQAAANAPRIYMALQPETGNKVSIVFAIDAAKDEDPTNDPAIRLTPEDGKCNPQELQRYRFPPDTARRPIFGPDEARVGVTAQDLPAFMAMAVTSEMLRRGLVDDPEDSKPQNVCTRKLWERIIVNESIRTG